MRLDISVSKKYNFSRNKAQALIEAGLISLNQVIIQKPSYEVTPVDQIDIQQDKRVDWVSRSAQKLQGFIEKLWQIGCVINIAWAYCLDVGSSTGGFTQILLEHWASHVDAVDVGTDQLHERIRDNIRVCSYEQTDIRDFRDIRKENKDYNIIVCDASFVSLQVLLRSILDLANTDTQIILLWKPQFEVGSVNLRKTWVPKNEKVVLQKQNEWESFMKENNCKILHKEKSSLIGEAWNQEWVYLIRKI